MKKILMMAAMALLCLTANAQKARHLPGDITVQPMIGVSEGFLSGKYNNFSFRSDDPRTGLTIGAEGEYFTNTRNLSLTAGLLYTQEGWMAKGSGPQTTKLNFINVPLMVAPRRATRVWATSTRVSTSVCPLVSLTNSRAPSPSICAISQP